jgi:hypothetical protein
LCVSIFSGGFTVKSYEKLNIDVIAVEDVTIASNSAESPYANGTGTNAWDFYLKDEGLLGN